MVAATVKPLRYIPNGKGAIRTAKDHIKYMTAPREYHRNNPHLFDATRDYVHRREFFDRLEKQRPSRRHAIMHKLVISFSEAERNRLRIDLKELTRDAMSRFETRLGQQLDWVAAIHDDRGHPHVHVVYRGRDLLGKPVFVGKEHLRDLRRIVEEEKVRQVERTFGPEKARQILEDLEKEMEARKRRYRLEREAPFRPDPDRPARVERSDGGRDLTGDLVHGIGNFFERLAREGEREAEQARKQARRAARRRKGQERGGR